MVVYINFYLLFASGFHLIRAETSQGLAVPCQSKEESAVKVSMTSHQNSTGDLIYEVSLEREKPAGRIPWLAQVEDDTTVCDGVEFLRTTSTITYPAPAPAPGSCPCPCPTHCPAQAQCSTQCPAPAHCPTLASCHTSGRRAGRGYVYYAGHGYYKFYRGKLTWHAAKKMCEQEGAHLAIINSEAESALLVKIHKTRNPNPSTYLHIGFHDKYENGQYLTVFDEPLKETGFVRWKSSNPSKVLYDECGSMYISSATLSEINCVSAFQFICEHN